MKEGLHIDTDEWPDELVELLDAVTETHEQAKGADLNDTLVALRSQSRELWPDLGHEECASRCAALLRLVFAAIDAAGQEPLGNG